ncbi:cupin domain-containing protein [Shouchella lehensis]|uniref:Cupin domain-containing protein n=1 Tax=Shouchella lehensis TaxID=300825 RepID=A0A4Y7WM01_9BACI|nr:cupin domain-containing protein [Shouchella lehensis]MBG9782936.1 hypothetical protein [Shouchella lehensis]TES49709.1 cupin domain-containing protein [Shouchella lehensis]
MRDISEITLQQHFFPDDGRIPNHPHYPFVRYPAVFDKTDAIEEVLERNHWRNTWRGSVFDYHHYHSNAHEVLVVAEGDAMLHIGGASGEELHVAIGDVLLLPAGTGHKFIRGSHSFTVVGAYPNGTAYNLCTGDPIEKDKHIQQIAAVPKPSHDPIFGENGPLLTLWT